MNDTSLTPKIDIAAPKIDIAVLLHAVELLLPVIEQVLKSVPMDMHLRAQFDAAKDAVAKAKGA